MNDVSFRDKMAALSTEFYKDRYNSLRSDDFWYIMDTFTDEQIILWAERATKLKNHFIHEGWDTKEWEQTNNIIHFYKTRDSKTQMPWTQSQKRFCTFQIVKFWDDLENQYFCV